jgi:hypothetical protein
MFHSIPFHFLPFLPFHGQDSVNPSPVRQTPLRPTRRL